MILASAQTKPTRGDINSNLSDHCRLIKQAADHGACLIVFPEMSITGYERENAAQFGFQINDARLAPLMDLAFERKIIVIAGAPLWIASNLLIGEFVIFPDRTIKIYTKQFLHLGEENYFHPSFDYNPVITIAGQRISLAICADIDHPIHAQNAGKVDTSIYIASIFFSPQGISSAHDSLSDYAKRYSMGALMSNFSGESWGRAAGGRSAFWDNGGKMIAQMTDCNSGLLIVEKINDCWKAEVVND